jgi:hypothetical protein
MIVLLSYQSEFLVMLNFFAHHVFLHANHFEQFHVKQNPSWHASRLMLSIGHVEVLVKVRLDLTFDRPTVDEGPIGDDGSGTATTAVKPMDGGSW